MFYSEKTKEAKKEVIKQVALHSLTLVKFLEENYEQTFNEERSCVCHCTVVCKNESGEKVNVKIRGYYSEVDGTWHITKMLRDDLGQNDITYKKNKKNKSGEKRI